MVKHLVAAVAVGVLLSACGGSDNKKQNNSSSSTAVSSAVSSAVVSSAASSAVVSSAVSSVAVSSSSSSEVAVSSSSSSEVAVSSSSSSEVVVSSSSSEASSEASSSSSSEASSEASSSSSSTGGNAPNCEPNPDSVINTCDTAKWVVDGGNGGSITFGELGPIFTNGAPTGTNSWNKPGMFYVLADAEVNKITVGKTLTLVIIVDQAFKDTGGDIQPVIQENGGSYGGYWSCPNNPNADMTPGQEQTITCTSAAGDLKDGIAELRLGFQLNNATNYLGTLELIDATWE